MELQENLLKDFADVVNGNGSEASGGNQTVYGQVTRVSNGQVYISIDGSDETIETPATALVEVGVGDRVMANIQNHSAVITGNITWPALTRVGETYITATNSGLQIGRLNSNNEPTGPYVVVGNSGTTIYDENHVRLATFGTTAQIGTDDAVHLNITSTGLAITDSSGKKYLARFNGDGVFLYKGTDHVLAEFTADGIVLRDSSGNSIATFSSTTIEIGKNNNALIKLCNGNGEISYADNKFKIAGASSTQAVGISNTYSTYSSELIAEAKSGSQRVGIQVTNGSNTVASVIADANGCNVTVPSGKALTVKKGTAAATEVVTVDGVVATGAVNWLIPASARSNTMYKLYTATITPPTGYKLVAIGQVYISNSDWALHEFSYSGNDIRVAIIPARGNAVATTPGEVNCRWVAIRTSGIVNGGSSQIDL